MSRNLVWLELTVAGGIVAIVTLYAGICWPSYARQQGAVGKRLAA